MLPEFAVSWASRASAGVTCAYHCGHERNEVRALSSTDQGLTPPGMVALVDDKVQIGKALKASLWFKGVAAIVHESAESSLAALTLRDGHLWLSDADGATTRLGAVVLDLNLPGHERGRSGGRVAPAATATAHPDDHRALDEKLLARLRAMQGLTLLSKPFTLESLEQALQAATIAVGYLVLGLTLTLQSALSRESIATPSPFSNTWNASLLTLTALVTAMVGHFLYVGMMLDLTPNEQTQARLARGGSPSGSEAVVGSGADRHAARPDFGQSAGSGRGSLH